MISASHLGDAQDWPVLKAGDSINIYNLRGEESDPSEQYQILLADTLISELSPGQTSALSHFLSSNTEHFLDAKATLEITGHVNELVTLSHSSISYMMSYQRARSHYYDVI